MRTLFTHVLNIDKKLSPFGLRVSSVGKFKEETRSCSKMRLFTLPLLAICFGAWIAGGYDNQTVPLTPTPLINLEHREPRWGIFFSYEKACTRACVKNGKFGGRMIGGVCRCWCVRNERAPCKGAYPSCNRLCKLNFYPMGGDCVDGLYCYCTCGVRQPQSPNGTETTTACPGGGGGGGGGNQPAINGDNSGQTIGNSQSAPSGPDSSAVQGPPPTSDGPFVSNPTGTGPGSGSPDSSAGANTPGGPFTNQSPGASSGEGSPGGGGGGAGGAGGGSGGGSQNQNIGLGENSSSGSAGGPANAGGGDGGSVAPEASTGNGRAPPTKIKSASPTQPVRDIGRWEAFKREYERLKALVPKYLGKERKQKRSAPKARTTDIL